MGPVRESCSHSFLAVVITDSAALGCLDRLGTHCRPSALRSLAAGSHLRHAQPGNLAAGGCAAGQPSSCSAINLSELQFWAGMCRISSSRQNCASLPLCRLLMATTLPSSTHRVSVSQICCCKALDETAVERPALGASNSLDLAGFVWIQLCFSPFKPSPAGNFQVGCSTFYPSIWNQ